MLKRRTKILLVEDDQDDYFLIENLLSSASPDGFDLEWIDDYDSASKSIQRHSHDVCLLDYRLGDRDGLDFLRDALKLDCSIPIIFLTGQGDYGVDVEAMLIGASDFLE